MVYHVNEPISINTVNTKELISDTDGTLIRMSHKMLANRHQGVLGDPLKVSLAEVVIS